MASRALPDLIARIRVDSSGVDSAMTNLIGSFGKASLAIAGVGAGIGLLVVGGKSMIDISEKHEKATANLEQAVKSYNSTLKATAATTVGTADEIAKRSDAQKLSQDALTISRNALTLSQLNYTDVVKKHGLHSEAALKALLSLHDSEIRYKQATEAAADATGQLNAAQALVPGRLAAVAINLEKYQSQIDDFIKTNRRYISDQSEVIDGYAKLTRSGLTETEVQKDMGRAVDLAAIKHISLSDAVDLLQKAETGRMRGLIDLGITTAKYTDAQGNLILSSHSVADAMAEVDAKTKGGRDTLTSLQKTSNILSNDWQDLSNKGGPVLITLLDVVIKKVTEIYDWFDRIGHDDKLWSTISQRLVWMAQGLRQAAIALGLADPNADPNPNRSPYPGPWSGGVTYDPKAHRFTQSGVLPTGAIVDNVTGQVLSPDARGGGWHPTDAQGRAGGGSVLPGRIYTVGEQGPETLVMGSSGGTVIPNGGGGQIHFHQVMADPWAIGAELAWLKKTKRL